MSSSSSSSSSEMYNGSQLMPFTYSSYKNTPITAFEFYGDYVFAGVSNSGLVIRSKNRYSWEKFYQTPDTNISALNINNGYLYIGTSPEGNVYRINLSTLSSESFGSMGSEIVDFAIFNKELYIAVNSPTTIMKLNTVTNRFEFVYTPYANINEMIVIGSNIYLALDASNIVSYNGTDWTKIIMDNAFTNISSYRNISKEVYSYSNSSFINTTDITSVYGFSDEDILDVLPIDSAIGVRCIAQDGTSIVLGASNFTRFYRFLNGNLNMIFNTEGESIDSILNIGVGVNLIASSNKVYLVYSGQINPVQTNAISESTTTVTPTVNPEAAIVVTYPDGGEIVQLNDTVNIQWSSTKGINDAVKIELLKGNTVALVINSQTSNSGTYAWEIPLSLIPSNDYKIRITWLAAGATNVDNVGESAGTFSIVKTIPTTTTTTTTLPNPQTPDTSSNRGIPILILPEYESITKMVNDNDTVLLATSNGRILRCDMITINGFLTGNKLVYADVYDGCGYIGSAQTVFNYSLYKKLVELDENKVIKKWKYTVDTTAIKTETITAIFQGPIVDISNGFGFWKELTWEETKPSGSNITISLRSATTENQILQQPWIYSTSSEDGETGTITRNLNNVGLYGQYLQVKIEMEVNTKNITPLVTNVTLKYSARDSSYFFTNYFTIDANNPVQKGLLTATISQPPNTEIQFGVSSENTGDWNKYQIVTPNKMFDLNDKELKVGIRFTSYSNSSPEVQEFAIMTGGEVLKGLNQ